MEKPSLNDKDQYPDDKVLSHHLGKAKIAWDSLMEMLDKNHPLFTREWRYYKDGHNWLYKVTKNKPYILMFLGWM